MSLPGDRKHYSFDESAPGLSVSPDASVIPNLAAATCASRRRVGRDGNDGSRRSRRPKEEGERVRERGGEEKNNGDGEGPRERKRG